VKVTGCSFEHGKLDLWNKTLWPEKCSQIECVKGMDGTPTLVYYPVAQGCDCCEFEGYLLADGEEAYDMIGQKVMCCKGVIDIVFPWSENSTGPGETTGGPGIWTPWSSWSSENPWTSWTGWSTWSPPVCSDVTYPSWGSDCACGQANSVQKIVGGEETLENEYPWQVGVLSDYLCGGTLISDQWVLTAAHCTVGQTASDFTVRLGYHDLYNAPGTGSIAADVCQIINHPDYNVAASTDYDFALLKLNTTINFNNYPTIRPACLPSDPTEDFAGNTATVSGWGTLSSGGSSPQKLQSVEVDVITNAECTTSPNLYDDHRITDSMLCAARDGKDSCQGDSGGPLVTQDSDGNYVLIGVVSWGIGCALDGYPGVYGRVTHVMDWISANTAEGWNTCDAP